MATALARIARRSAGSNPPNASQRFLSLRSFIHAVGTSVRSASASPGLVSSQAASPRCLYGRRWPSLALMSSASLPRNPRPSSCAAIEKVSRSMAASWSSARPARTISVRMHSSSSPTAIGMPVSCACAACALGALRPPLIIGGRTSGGASASGSVSPPVARYQVHAPSPGASLAGAYVLEATTTPPERGWTLADLPLPGGRSDAPRTRGESAGAFAAGRKAAPADGANGARRGVHSRIAEPCRAARPRVTVRGSSAMIGSTEARHRPPPSFLAQPVSARSRSRLSRHAAPRGSVAVGARLFAPSPPWLASGSPLSSWTPPASFCPRTCSRLPARSRR